MEINSELKATHMTDEYAAHYLLKQGYLAGRIEALQAIRDAQEVVTIPSDFSPVVIGKPIAWASEYTTGWQFFKKEESNGD